MSPLLTALMLLALQTADPGDPGDAMREASVEADTATKAVANPSSAETASSSTSGTTSGAFGSVDSGEKPQGDGPAVIKPPAPDPLEAADVAILRGFESRLSVGERLDDDDVSTVKRLMKSAAPRARALSAAVIAWLDPAIATAPLITAVSDPDPRVRTAAGASLVALARRLDESARADVVAAGLQLMDDTDDEVACVGAELLASLRPPGLAEAFASRKDAASDVRYGCFVRFGGLPIRAVTLPPLPDDDDVANDVPPDAVAPPAAPAPWLFVGTAAAAGLLVGGAAPTMVFPARDVLVYNADQTRLSRQETSFGTQLLSSAVGGVAFGGAAWALSEAVGPLTLAESINVAGGTGSGALLGAGLGFMLTTDGSTSAGFLAAGTTLGVAGATTAGLLGDVSHNDNALMASAMALGGLGAGLLTFAAVPVAQTQILDVGRTDFGLGSAVAGAGLAGLVAMAAGPFVEVDAARSAAIAGGGLLGGGLMTGLGFLVVPADLEVGSRIASGLGLAGEVAGAIVAGYLVPDEWLGVVQNAAVEVSPREARFGLPVPVAFAPLPGQTVAPVGVMLVHGTL